MAEYTVVRFDVSLADVHRLEFGPLGGGAHLGTYRQVGRHTWKEDGDTAGRDLFTFSETGRSGGTITLFDASRRVTLRVDLQRGVIRFAHGSDPEWDLYALTDVSPRPTGQLLTRVEYGPNPGTVDGTLTQVGPGVWSETIGDGDPVSYDEVARDDVSVTLHDPLHDVHLEVDLAAGPAGAAGVAAHRVGDGRWRDRYLLSSASCAVHGRLANKVDVRLPGGTDVVGSYRQTDSSTWVVEGMVDSPVDSPVRAALLENFRDDGSVYLVDNTRGLFLQLDLHAGTVIRSALGEDAVVLYEVAAADVLPQVGVPDARDVTLVHTDAVSGGEPLEYRYLGGGRWDVGGSVLREIARTQDVIHLEDLGLGIPLELDVATGTMRILGVPTPSRITAASCELTGWLVRSAAAGVSPEVTSVFRQVGWASWVEDTASGGLAEHVYDETARDDGTVTLHDVTRDIQIGIDVRRRAITYTPLRERPHDLYTMAEARTGPEPWRQRHRISSRSALTQSFDLDANRQRVPRPVYRTSVTLPPATTHVDVWASEETTLEIDGTFHTVDPVRPARVRPSRLARLSIALPATDLHCPKILLGTNLMEPGRRHVLHPDVEAHRKIVALPPGALAAASTSKQVHLDPSFDSGHIADLQRTMQNLARTVQHTYNDSPHGVHHDRALLPANMEHLHFKVDFAGGGVRYSPLSVAEVHAHIDGAERIVLPAGQLSWSDIGDWFTRAAHIVVHTVTAVVHDVVDTVEHVAKDVVETVDHVGEDLVHGDLLRAGKDLVQGGEHLGTDLVKGVVGVGGDLVSGAGQLVAVTMKVGEKLLQYVIDHTGMVGQALGWLLHKAGAALGEVVGWLLDKVGWDDVLHTHDVLADLADHTLDRLVKLPQDLKGMSDRYFASLATSVGQGIDGALAALDVEKLTPETATTPGHSGAMEQVEWLLSLVTGNADTVSLRPATVPGGAGPAPAGGTDDPFDAVLKAVTDELDGTHGEVLGAFDDALRYLQLALRGSAHGDRTAEDLLGAVLELVKALVLLGIEIVARIADALLDLVSAIVAAFRTAIDTPLDIPFLTDFYAGVTHGRTLTVASLACLLIATPVTIVHREMFGDRAFAAAGPVLELKPLSGLSAGSGIAYSCCQLLLAVLATGTDVTAAVNRIGNNAAPAQAAGNGVEMQPVSQAARAQAAAAERSAKDTADFQSVMAGANAFVSLGTLFAGNPVSWEENAFDAANPRWNPAAGSDVLVAPVYWSHVTWAYLCFGWIASLPSVPLPVIGQRSGWSARRVTRWGDAVCVANLLFGIGTVALMLKIDHADRVKAGVVATGLGPLPDGLPRSPRQQLQAMESAGALLGYTPTSPTAGISDEDVTKRIDELTNYLEWAQSPHGLDLKVAGNVLDGLPSVGQVFAIDAIVEGTDGWSLLGLVAFDALGHLLEGIIYSVRTGQRGLL